MGLAGKVILFALAAFGAFMLVDWVLGWIFGLVKFALLIVVVVAVAALLISRGARDD